MSEDGTLIVDAIILDYVKGDHIRDLAAICTSTLNIGMSRNQCRICTPLCFSCG